MWDVPQALVARHPQRSGPAKEKAPHDPRTPPARRPADSPARVRELSATRSSRALRTEVWSRRSGVCSNQVGRQRMSHAPQPLWPRDPRRLPEGFPPVRYPGPDGWYSTDVCRRRRREFPRPKAKAARAARRSARDPSCRRQACPASTPGAGPPKNHHGRTRRCARRAYWPGHLRRPPTKCPDRSSDRGWSPTERRHCRRRCPGARQRSGRRTGRRTTPTSQGRRLW